MTDAFRQKLLNWLTCMGLVILLTNLCLAAFWFFNEPNPISRPIGTPRPFTLNLTDYAGPFGEIIVVYVYAFLAVAVWHLLDFATRSDRITRPANPLASYGLFVCGLFLAGIAWICVASGEFLTVKCMRDEEGNVVLFGFDVCREELASWIPWTSTGGIVLIGAAWVGKAVALIKSHMRKPA